MSSKKCMECEKEEGNQFLYQDIDDEGYPKIVTVYLCYSCRVAPDSKIKDHDCYRYADETANCQKCSSRKWMKKYNELKKKLKNTMTKTESISFAKKYLEKRKPKMFPQRVSEIVNRGTKRDGFELATKYVLDVIIPRIFKHNSNNSEVSDKQGEIFQNEQNNTIKISGDEE